jgi:hypothetical protein
MKWDTCCLKEAGNSRVRVNYWGTLTLDDGRPASVSEDEFKTIYIIQSSRREDVPESGFYDSFDCTQDLDDLDDW